MSTTTAPGIPIQDPSQLADAYSPGDDWTGVNSTATRRKLQNRLNQRARRRRERAQQESARVPPPEGQAHDPECEYDLSVPHYDSQLLEKKRDSQSSCLLGQLDTRDMLIKIAEQCYSRYKAGSPNTMDLAVVIRFNVFHAFALNAQMLGFNNDWLTYEATSPFNLPGKALEQLMSARRPPTMEPTTLQVSVEHHPWIDFFPCPRLRDNMLRNLIPGRECIDEDALCRDVVDAGAEAGIGSAAFIVWGHPWEPGSWEITEAFMTKWGWLMDGCTELLHSSNQWREKRGLKSLEAGTQLIPA